MCISASPGHTGETLVKADWNACIIYSLFFLFFFCLIFFNGFLLTIFFIGAVQWTTRTKNWRTTWAQTVTEQNKAWRDASLVWPLNRVWGRGAALWTWNVSGGRRKKDAEKELSDRNCRWWSVLIYDLRFRHLKREGPWLCLGLVLKEAAVLFLFYLQL